MKNYIKLMRVKHYLKNGLIFLPILFGGKLFDSALLSDTMVAFIIFSLCASAIYIFNDIQDVEKDRKHLHKQKRPLASGAISIKSGMVTAVVLMAVAVGLTELFFSGKNAFALCIPLLYIGINALYSLGGKNIPVLDIFILSTGFVLRVIYGGLVTDIEISNWLYLTIFSLSFYLGMGKRRNEISAAQKETRDVQNNYNYNFLDKNMYVFLTGSIVFYSLWCVNTIDSGSASQLLIFTVPLIMLICMKYSLTIEGDSYGDPIEVLIKDKVLILLVLLYGLAMYITIY